MLKSIALRLMSSFLMIIVIISAIFSYVGIRFIENRVVTEAQNRVAESLMAAGEIYGNQLHGVQQVARLTADRIFLKDALRSGRSGRAASVLSDVRRQEQLDVLVVTDAAGRVSTKLMTLPQILGQVKGLCPMGPAVMLPPLLAIEYTFLLGFDSCMY